MEELDLSFNFRARYYRSGASASTKKVWVVLHGYGQLAQFFIRKFKVLNDLGIVVIAPEGLSRFYLEDVTTRVQTGNTRVGATWMTRENRNMDIANYLAYLDAVYLRECAAAGTEVTLLGFSQGAATASRWAVSRPHTFHQLVLWAGILPPDMEVASAREALGAMKVTSVVGLRDPFFTEERKQEMTSMADRLGLRPTVITFEGGHEINEDVLRQLAS
jgi:predicted esterase